MVLIAALAATIALTQRSHAADPISPSKIKQLAVERQKFFTLTSELPKSGFTNDFDFGVHDIVFPIGRSDVLYYICSDMNSSQLTDGNFKVFNVTKWRAAGHRYKKVWQLLCLDGASRKAPAATFFSLLSGLGYRPDISSSAWPQARQDVERIWPYALYGVDLHPTVMNQPPRIFVQVYDAFNHGVGPSCEVSANDRVFPVTASEVQLINAARSHH